MQFNFLILYLMLIKTCILCMYIFIVYFCGPPLHPNLIV